VLFQRGVLVFSVAFYSAAWHLFLQRGILFCNVVFYCAAWYFILQRSIFGMSLWHFGFPMAAENVSKCMWGATARSTAGESISLPNVGRNRLDYYWRIHSTA
jgi:hypothetical protein